MKIHANWKATTEPDHLWPLLAYKFLVEIKYKSGNTWMRFPLKDIKEEWWSIGAKILRIQQQNWYVYVCVRAYGRQRARVRVCACYPILFMIMYNLYNHIYILVLKSI